MPSRIKTWQAIPLVGCLIAVMAAGPAHAVPKMGAAEIAMGRTAAKEAEKENKLLDDRILEARVQAIGEALSRAANDLQVSASYGCDSITPFDYTFKVIDSDDVNAFSLPGGRVYVNKGVIKLCQSDHELAAVISHEIAHAAHHHMVYLLSEQSKVNGRCALVLLAGILANAKPNDLSNVMLGAQLYRTSKVNGYGQKAELDADETGLAYMVRAGYNPVGMLTFLERLAERPDMIDWGILQTHPRSADRADVVRNRLVELGITINRRTVAPSLGALVKEAIQSTVPVFEVIVDGIEVCKLASQTDAQQTANRINELLDNGLQIRELQADGPNVAARGRTLMTISNQDSAIANKPASEVAWDAREALRHALSRQMIRDIR